MSYEASWKGKPIFGPEGGRICATFILNMTFLELTWILIHVQDTRTH